MGIAGLSVDQEDALNRMRSGCILNGGVGSGKSRTALAFYYISCGGQINSNKFSPLTKPMNLYIITTARKRDDLEWDGELAQFGLSTDPKTSTCKNIKIIIDSWNNIKKYCDIKDSFFIFDEQRVVGYGAWVKTFLKITKCNKWILLTATPGDKWEDYIPVFIANGFYRNKTDFTNKHIVYSRFTNFPSVARYLNEPLLIKLRNRILIKLNYNRITVANHEYVDVSYDKNLYDRVVHDRWNVYENKPIENASEYCSVLRRIVNSSPDRQIKLLEILEKRKKVIIFYNYNYELDILRKLLSDISYPFTEWNGHKHEPLLEKDKWAYLVQYTAGAEAWNCITTDSMVFFSQSYSYKQMVQAAGRIDRRNTPYRNLYYYHFKSSAKIDSAISKCLKRKKQFSEKGFAPSDLSPGPTIKPNTTSDTPQEKNLMPMKVNGMELYCTYLDRDHPMYDKRLADEENKYHKIRISLEDMFKTPEKKEESKGDFGGVYDDWD